MGAKENFQNWVRTQARKRVQERKPCTQEWLEMQKRHFNKRNEIFDARIRRILTTASKK